MQETPVRFLGQEDPLEKGKATHSSILAWRTPWTVHQVTKSQTRQSDFHFTSRRRDILTQATACMKLEVIILSEIKPVTKGQMLYFTHMTPLEEPNL